MNIKGVFWILAACSTLFFTACRNDCDSSLCNDNQVAGESPFTGECECQCQNGFVGTDCTFTQNEFDVNLIKAYLDENSIDAEETANGLHYVITDSAGGTTGPEITDIVDITYRGYLLDGTEFDSGTIDISLQSVIPGWQQGIPFFAKGDKGMIFIPSSLAYGTNPPNPTIPVNAVLIFDVELHNF